MLNELNVKISSVLNQNGGIVILVLKTQGLSSV